MSVTLPSTYARTEAALARRLSLAEDALANGRLSVDAANRLLDRVTRFCDQWPWSARSGVFTRAVNRLRGLLAQPTWVELAIGTDRVRVSSIPVGAGPVARRRPSMRPPNRGAAGYDARVPRRNAMPPPRVQPTPIDWGNYTVGGEGQTGERRRDSIRTPSIPPTFSFRNLFS